MFADPRDDDGGRVVIHNGHNQPRTVLTSAGAVEVTALRVKYERTMSGG